MHVSVGSQRAGPAVRQPQHRRAASATERASGLPPADPKIAAVVATTLALANLPADANPLVVGEDAAPGPQLVHVLGAREDCSGGADSRMFCTAEAPALTDAPGLEAPRVKPMNPSLAAMVSAPRLQLVSTASQSPQDLLEELLEKKMASKASAAAASAGSDDAAGGGPSSLAVADASSASAVAVLPSAPPEAPVEAVAPAEPVAAAGQFAGAQSIASWLEQPSEVASQGLQKAEQALSDGAAALGSFLERGIEGVTPEVSSEAAAAAAAAPMQVDGVPAADPGGVADSIASDGSQLLLSDALAGAGVLCAGVAGAMWYLHVKNEEEQARLSERISGLESDKSALGKEKQELQGQVAELSSTLTETKDTLKQERSAKVEQTARADDLTQRLAATTANLGDVTKRQRRTAEEVSSLTVELDQERKAAAALGEQVIDLSSQLEKEVAQTKSLTEQKAGLRDELEQTAEQLAEQVRTTEALQTDVRALQSNITALEQSVDSKNRTLDDMEKAARHASEEAAAAYAELSSKHEAAKSREADYKNHLTQTTTELQDSLATCTSLEQQLAAATNKGVTLQERLDAALSDIAKAHNALETQQQHNSKLMSAKEQLESRMDNLNQALHDTRARLSSESSVASEAKSQLEELKLEYIAAGDKLEEEQGVIRQLQLDLKSKETALTKVSHERKTALFENAQLATQLEDSQAEALTAQKQSKQASEELKLARSEMESLRKAYEETHATLQASQKEASNGSKALEEEKLLTRELQAQVSQLNKHVVGIEEAERSARQQAQEAMAVLRRDVEKARVRTRRAKGGLARGQPDKIVVSGIDPRKHSPSGNSHVADDTGKAHNMRS